MPGNTPYESFAVRVARVVAAIPPGRVATYAQVAGMAGASGAARQVAKALWALSGSRGLPWHRVINSKGTVSIPGAGGVEQRALLEAEGVEFSGAGIINLARFGWRG